MHPKALLHRNMTLVRRQLRRKISVPKLKTPQA
jgi:hypothetical protein